MPKHHSRKMIKPSTSQDTTLLDPKHAYSFLFLTIGATALLAVAQLIFCSDNLKLQLSFISFFFALIFAAIWSILSLWLLNKLQAKKSSQSLKKTLTLFSTQQLICFSLILPILLEISRVCLALLLLQTPLTTNPIIATAILSTILGGLIWYKSHWLLLGLHQSIYSILILTLYFQTLSLGAVILTSMLVHTAVIYLLAIGVTLRLPKLRLIRTQRKA